MLKSNGGVVRLVAGGLVTRLVVAVVGFVVKPGYVVVCLVVVLVVGGGVVVVVLGVRVVVDPPLMHLVREGQSQYFSVGLKINFFWQVIGKPISFQQL